MNVVQVGRLVQYRLTQTDADTFSVRPGVARRYIPGDILPAVVLSVRSGRCDLHVLLHGPATGYVRAAPEHYAAEGSWTHIPGK